jgi:hypothetical protein
MSDIRRFALQLSDARYITLHPHSSAAHLTKHSSHMQAFKKTATRNDLSNAELNNR